MNINIKRNQHFIYILVALFLSALSFYYLKKDSASTVLKFGIVDSERLKNEASLFDEVKNKIDSEIEKIRQEFIPHSTALESEFEILKKEKNTQKAKVKKEKFEKKKADVEALFLKKQNYLQNLQAALSQKLNDLVLETIKSTAHKKGIHIIVNKFIDEKLVVLHANHELDLTDEIIQQINKKKGVLNISEKDLKLND